MARSSCRGPSSLGGYFKLVNGREISLKRIGCAPARKVVKRFPKTCAHAYAAQGRCKIRSRARWAPGRERADDPASSPPRPSAHELFHAYSLFGLAGGVSDTWWEEASATWAQGKTGFREERGFDIDLQYPNEALDSTDPLTCQYAMSRFVQFLDSRHLIGDPSWPLEHLALLVHRSSLRQLCAAVGAEGEAAIALTPTPRADGHVSRLARWTRALQRV